MDEEEEGDAPGRGIVLGGRAPPQVKTAIQLNPGDAGPWRVRLGAALDFAVPDVVSVAVSCTWTAVLRSALDAGCDASPSTAVDPGTQHHEQQRGG
jgi:hypothetical protein